MRQCGSVVCIQLLTIQQNTSVIANYRSTGSGACMLLTRVCAEFVGRHRIVPEEGIEKCDPFLRSQYYCQPGALLGIGLRSSHQPDKCQWLISLVWLYSLHVFDFAWPDTYLKTVRTHIQTKYLCINFKSGASIAWVLQRHLDMLLHKLQSLNYLFIVISSTHQLQRYRCVSVLFWFICYWLGKKDLDAFVSQIYWVRLTKLVIVLIFYVARFVAFFFYIDRWINLCNLIVLSHWKISFLQRRLTGKTRPG